MTDAKLLENLELWLATRPRPPTIFEVIETGDGQLFAAFVLKALRAAAREAVEDRLGREAALMHPASLDGANVVFRVLDGISSAWALTDEELLELLGLGDPGELQAARAKPITEIPIGIIERLAILLDIFQAINILLPDPKRADAWIRKPNQAPAFEGAPALSVMLSGLAGLRTVRAYLNSQRYGG